MAFLFLLCAAQNGLDDDDEEEEEEPFKKGFLPHQTHQRGSRPPSTSRDFHKMERRRERSPFRRELEKKRYGWWLSLSSLLPERGLQAFPLKGAPFQGHPRWKNCEQGFDKVESLWKGRDGAWGREGKPFSRKVL